MALMFLSRRKNKRSNLNWSHVKVTDLSVGTITPVGIYEVSKGDRLRFSPSSFMQAMPMKAPLVNGFKLCLEYFFVPNRLYHGQLLLDEMGVTDAPEQVVFPTVQPELPSIPSKDVSDNAFELHIYAESATQFIGSTPPDKLAQCMVQPGSFANFMGFPVGWLPSKPRVSDNTGPSIESDADDLNFVNVVPALAYLDIFLNYYADQQQEYFYTSLYVPNPLPGTVPSPGTEPISGSWRQMRYRLSDLQEFVNGLKRSVSPSRFIREWFSAEGSTDYTVFMSWQFLCCPNSLFQRAFRPYYLESWLRTSYADSIDNTIKVDVENGSVAFTDIRRQSHYQRFIDLAMSGGSRYSDYEEAQFDLGRVKNFTTPLFLGSDRQFLGSRVIYQTTGFDSAESPLGSFAGQASGGDRFKRRSITFSEDGYFLVLATLVPDTIYYRGLDPSVRHIRLDDLYVPAKDNIGMEPLPVEQLDSFLPITALDAQGGSSPAGTKYSGVNITLGRDISGSATDQQRAVGYVPAWSSTVQQVSRAYGSLQGDLKYWLLAREYAGNPFPEEYQSYVDQYLQRAADKWAKWSDAGLDGPYLPSYLPALRTFFDNLRRGSLYMSYIQNHLYNSVFADTSVDAHNFVLTLSFDMTVNREKSKVNIPSTI